ncbi:hypothetical protein [Mycobacterium pseudokansasii]|uniref:Uncharacterized protein n=1 Tax=Mycobacterium pseudokansasii TaxID=2341080 RepID=A0A498QZ35_9MYCO|nr:hypothetical protein [Mycobacterium pseudokansasii]VBA56012.1 hypothetical protein LAUMK142_05346 [Mycobacterium pseudokansasii]
MDAELYHARNIVEALGHSGLTTEYWAAVVATADAWGEAQRLEGVLREVAASVGITAEQWDSIRRGG